MLRNLIVTQSVVYQRLWNYSENTGIIYYLTVNQLVAGSSPAAGASFKKGSSCGVALFLLGSARVIPR